MSGFDEFDPDGFADDLAMAFALFVSLLALWELVSSATSSSSEPAATTGRGAHLPEPALERLERGETVVVERWHGHDLELSGTQVIDVSAVKEQED